MIVPLDARLIRIATDRQVEAIVAKAPEVGREQATVGLGKDRLAEGARIGEYASEDGGIVSGARSGNVDENRAIWRTRKGQVKFGRLPKPKLMPGGSMKNCVPPMVGSAHRS